MNKFSYRTLGDIVLLTVTLLAVLTLAGMNAHFYSGENKGVYIGKAENCTVGFEYSGSIGFFGNLSGCDLGQVIKVSAMEADVAETSKPQAKPGGDCFADLATGDTWKGNNWYCRVIPPEVTKTRSQSRYVPNGGTVAETDKPIDDGGVILEDKPEEPKEDSCTHGNPGNTKCVGNAGENPNGRGTMPLDNAGGHGNGEHGNQGQGGNHSAFGISALLIGFLKLRKVNDAYFFPTLMIGNHVSISVWVHVDDWRFFLISPSSANNEAYYCLNMYLGILNISYTWLA